MDLFGLRKVKKNVSFLLFGKLFEKLYFMYDMLFWGLTLGHPEI